MGTLLQDYGAYLTVSPRGSFSHVVAFLEPGIQSAIDRYCC